MILANAVKMEEYFDCKICGSTLLKPTMVGECGHVFCSSCIHRSLKEEPDCPTCKTPADSKNLKPDRITCNMMIYLDDLNSFLTGSLTPLDLSIMRQQGIAQSQKVSLSQASSTDKEYQIEDSSMGESQAVNDSFIKKRALTDTDTQDTTTNDELENEFDDSLPQKPSQPTKRFKAASESESPEVTSHITGAKATDKNENKHLLEPKNLLADFLTPSQDDSELASASDDSEGGVADNEQPSANEDQIMTDADEPLSQSTQVATHTTKVEDFIPDTVPSDTEESNIDDKAMWKCSACKYSNKTYLQTCSFCHAYQNRRLSDMAAPAKPTSTRNARKNTASTSNKKPYELTVAADEENAQVDGTFTAPNTRRRSDSLGRKEVHILYTGLTPADEKSLEKIKEEADQKLKIVIHYEMRNFDDVTHVITSVDKKHLCKRTLKYLQGVLKGKWIVEPKWVTDSMKAKKWQEEKKYEVKGDHLTGKTHAPKRARESQPELLLQDVKLFFHGDFSGKHNKNDLFKLCRAGGATILSRKPPGRGSRVMANAPLDPEEPIVIQGSEKKKPPAWLSQCQVRDPQWIIDCISKFRVE